MIRKNKILSALALLLSVACVLSSAAGCTKGGRTGEKVLYTVEAKTEGGLPLAGVVINVYKDSTLTELVWAATTDENGSISFEAEKSGDYVAALKEPPKGYKTESSYPLTAEKTELRLSATLLSPDSVKDSTFALGDVFCDLSVTDFNGEEYKISELLKKKQAVVLNFWFINCGPCKMEFPYLEEAYGKYKDKLEVLAVNPVDGTDSKLADFAKDNSLTFPMAVGESDIEKAMKLTAYPTTVVIDRYGTIAFIHKGSITEPGEFEKIFEYFTSASYTQTTVRDLSDIAGQ